MQYCNNAIMQQNEYTSSICATFSILDDILLFEEQVYLDEEQMNAEYNSVTIVNMVSSPRAAGRG